MSEQQKIGCFPVMTASPAVLLAQVAEREERPWMSSHVCMPERWPFGIALS